MFVFDIDLIVIDSKELVKHGFISPRSKQGSYHIFLPLRDNEQGSLIFGIVTGFLDELIFHSEGHLSCNFSTGIRLADIPNLWQYSERHS